VKSNPVEISVVVPCFNDGNYIQETIASVKAQTCQDVEIIVVDDASTDKDTQNILRSLEEERVKVLFSTENSGPSVARNLGITQAKGKYILPLDADDKIAPSYLEKAKKVLDNDPQVGIVYCEAEFFGKKRGKWDLPPYAFPQILVGNMIFATAMYRKEDWERVGGYNHNMRQGNEDYDFWLSLLELGRKVYQIPEVLFFYRIKETSRTTKLKTDNTDEIDTYVQIFRNHQKLYLDHIDIFFKELSRRQQQLLEKDDEIRMLHRKLYAKDQEIVQLYQKLNPLGDELRYARSVIALRDRQIESLRLKNRLKRAVKKINPFAKEDLSLFLEPEKYLPVERPGYQYHLPRMTDAEKSILATFTHKPLISIIMPVYNVDPQWLDKAIKSIEAQWYENWELCIADDKSTDEKTLSYLNSVDNSKIKIRFLEKNLNISGASNAALEMAEGEYIALMDNDDEITPDALFEMVKSINTHQADFIYSDEDFVSVDGIYSNPHFKPDWSPDLLLSHNYITHFTCFKRTLLDEIGMFRSTFDGAQDYDLFLRMTEKSRKIHHIQRVLYHWRTIEGSTSADSEAKPEALERGRKALEEAMQRRGIDATVEHANMHHYFRVRYRIKNEPLVSIIIPFKDKPELLKMCVHSILEHSTYKNYEIIGISNNSTDPDVFELMKIFERQDKRVKFYEYNTEFNYADINNHAVNTYAKGEHLLLLNNDIEVISPNWIESMLEHSQREEIGCVGAKLYYPNDTIQHAGIIIGLGGYAGHSHKMYPRNSPGYFNRLMVVQNVSAVTAACLMVKKEIYQKIGGMDAENFKVAYNDVDFCLRVQEEGYRNIYTPYAEMYHHESVSRGHETTPEKIVRFEKEKEALQDRHLDIFMQGDPYYNPNLCHDKEDFSICPK
jgi:glycosyltransferase involved in cell wall biosynthesis